MLKDFPYRIILGSASPRRKELLQQLELEFEVRTKSIAEDLPANMNAQDAAEHLAIEKANAQKQLLKDDELLITADTVVIDNGKVLGKPNSVEEASSMLTKLSGSQHEVVTGVCISGTAFQSSFSESTMVRFYPLNKKEIAHYVRHYEPMDKAGSYGIQEWIGLIGVQKIEGCFFNVIGLPVPRLYQELKRLL